jgi:hypothetical protein
MNKLYLLAILGAAVKADITGDVTGVDASSNGWYAGDCLDAADFSSSYGGVVECDASGCDSGSTDGGDIDYYALEAAVPGCYTDGMADEDFLLCYLYTINCDLSGDATYCQETAYGCDAGDEDCLADAVCYGDEDCLSTLADNIANWTYGDESGRRLRTPSTSADLPYRW